MSNEVIFAFGVYPDLIEKGEDFLAVNDPIEPTSETLDEDLIDGNRDWVVSEPEVGVKHFGLRLAGGGIAATIVQRQSRFASPIYDMNIGNATSESSKRLHDIIRRERLQLQGLKVGHAITELHILGSLIEISEEYAEQVNQVTRIY